MLPIVLLVALAALLAAAVLVRRRRPARPQEAAPAPKVLAAAVAPAPSISGTVAPPPRPVHAVVDPLDALDALLAELESTTVLIDGADELDERAVVELEGLAARLEAAAESFAAR
jgi:hypothetical protein